MGMKRTCFLLLVASYLHGYCLAQGEPGRFSVSQVTFRSPVLRAYVDALDQNGQPPANLPPAQFAATMQRQNLKVVSVTSFDQTGEGVAYAFLVDISRSIKPAQFDEMRTEVNKWISGMSADDRMAIYTFGDQNKELIDFTADKATLTAALQNVVPTDNQTKLYLALRNAIDVGQRTDANLPSRRVIVILSDGKDEGSGFTAEDVGRMFQQSPIPIYAIGFSQLPLAERETYLEALNRVAGLSGGLYIAGSSLPEAYTAIREAIRRVFVVQLACAGCRISTQPQPLELTLKTGTLARTDRLAVNLAIDPQTSLQLLLKWLTEHVALSIVIAGALAVFLLILVALWWLLRKKPLPATVAVPVPLVPHVPFVPTAPVLPVSPNIATVSTPSGRKVQLTVMSGAEKGRVDYVSLAARAVVGRDKSCSVSYPEDHEMSAKHFELIPAGANVEVQDLGSMNGTLMNGARLLTQQRLEDGDWVRAGRTEVRINFGA